MNDTSDNSFENTIQETDDDATRLNVRINYPEITDLEINQIIGKGGSGIVYKGRQLFLKRDVAIKVLIINPEDQEFYKRFQREAQILAKLSHHNIVSCYQAGMTNDTQKFRPAPFIAMEFINGPSLQEWILKKGKLNCLLALDVAINMANALNYALKQGIIHRDVKAENILLNPVLVNQTGNNELDEFQFIPKLADLGIARTYHSDRSDDLTQVGYMVGTPSSMAPEQFNEPDNVDFKVDIYGLGCVLFYMLTGEKPYKGNNLSNLIISKNSDVKKDPIELVPELDNDLAELVTRMLAKEKEKRPSYEQVIQQCQVISDRLKQVNSPKAKLLTHAPKIAIVSLFLIIGGVTSSLIFNSEDSQDRQQNQELESSTLENDQVVPDKIPDYPEHAEPEPEPEPEPESWTQETEALPETTTTPLDLDDESVSDDNSQVSADKISLSISYADKEQALLSPGELFNVFVHPDKDAYIYCYYQDQSNSIIRFYPNRFNENALVSANNGIILPGDMPFDLNVNEEGVTEFITCFAFEQDISYKVPTDILGTDFEPLVFFSMQEIRNAFFNSGYELLNEQTLEIKVQQKIELNFGQ